MYFQEQMITEFTLGKSERVRLQEEKGLSLRQKIQWQTENIMLKKFSIGLSNKKVVLWVCMCHFSRYRFHLRFNVLPTVCMSFMTWLICSFSVCKGKAIFISKNMVIGNNLWNWLECYKEGYTITEIIFFCFYPKIISIFMYILSKSCMMDFAKKVAILWGGFFFFTF